MNKKYIYVNFWPNFHREEYLIDKIINKFTNLQYTENVESADLLIIGPFGNMEAIKKIISKKKLFISHENLMPDYRYYDFSITFTPFDYDERNIRWPYWANYFDFSDYGLKFHSDRALKPYKIENRDFNKFKGKIDEFCTCLGVIDYTRYELLRNIEKVSTINKAGKAFNINIDDKIDFFSKYRYIFCPENTYALGYVTEKIPDAYCSGGIPITYVDANQTDFNPRAIINLALVEEGQQIDDYIREKISTNKKIENIFQQQLFLNKPKIEKIIEFIEKVTKE